jgi:Metallopeptidase family M24
MPSTATRRSSRPRGRYIGHFVGIGVHDVIDIVGTAAQKPFVAGTVFNVEPILEFPDRKVHIRLEDTVIVTETGAENVTAGVPADVEPLYAHPSARGQLGPGRKRTGKVGAVHDRAARGTARPGQVGAGYSESHAKTPVTSSTGDQALEEERWLPRPYCLAATPGTGYCGVLLSCQCLDARGVKRVARSRVREHRS